MTVHRRRSHVFVLALAGVLLGSATSSARPGIVDWPTYLRAGPGRQYVVLQELARGVILDIGECTGQWCSVRIDRVAGYIDRANLGDETALSPPTPAAPMADCFPSQRNGYATGETFRYCNR